MRRQHPVLIAGLAVAALMLTGCSATKTTTASQATTAASAAPSPTTTVAKPSARTMPTSAMPTPSPKPTTTHPRTRGDLTKALLALKDMPPGFQIERADSPDRGGAPTASSKDRRCAALVADCNADVPRGAMATADRSFSGGQDSPFVDEALAAMRTPAAAKSYLSFYRSATKSCRAMTVKISRKGSSTVTVSEVSPPSSGEDTLATRFTARGGSLDGLEVTEVMSRADDVLLTMSFEATGGDDIDGSTELALDKLKQAFGAGSDS